MITFHCTLIRPTAHLKWVFVVVVLMPTIAGLDNRAALGAKVTDPNVAASIARGSLFLARSAVLTDGGHAGIAALGLLKSGTSPDDPVIKKIIETRLLTKFQEDGTYKSSAPSDLYYEAGVDLMVYSDTHPEAYEKEIKALIKLLLEGQFPDGYWSYPVNVRPGDRGDTSITQYALLGLWDADRAGYSVSTSVWDRAASWLSATQDSDGSFWYHPGNQAYKPTPSMAAAGAANLLVCRVVLHGIEGTLDRMSASSSRREGGQRFGVLKKIDLTPVVRVEGRSLQTKRTVSRTPKTSKGRLDSSARRGLEWIDGHWIGTEPTKFRLYYYYALERACSLAGAERIGDHDWYDEISDGLLKMQRPDGAWSESDQAGDIANTAFALLFLSRATARIIKQRPDEKTFGGGLMIGGRGLPTNLGAVQTGADGIQVRKLAAPVDQLLSELEDPKSTQVEAAQQAIVERVELGDREGLVGQKSRLLRLARDPRVEVRRTVIWALGRCATIHEANVLVKALDDPEISVVVEANNALCWFSRRPNGFGRPADPIAALPENASERQKEEAAKSWRTRVRADWREWFENVRPYSERNLPIDSP
jgi:Prenyltransferase and squalene oxidase repeat